MWFRRPFDDGVLDRAAIPTPDAIPNLLFVYRETIFPFEAATVKTQSVRITNIGFY
jgi:hypothetical protein